MKEKKKRAPGAGRKRTAGLSQTGAIAKLPPIWVDAETLAFLRTLPNTSAFVREAINEKRVRAETVQDNNDKDGTPTTKNPHS